MSRISPVFARQAATSASLTGRFSTLVARNISLNIAPTSLLKFWLSTSHHWSMRALSCRVLPSSGTPWCWYFSARYLAMARDSEIQQRSSSSQQLRSIDGSWINDYFPNKPGTSPRIWNSDAIPTRWLAYQNRGYCHFSCNLRSSHGYLVHYQSEESHGDQSGHIGPPNYVDYWV